MTCVTWCEFSGTFPGKTDPGSQLVTWEVSLATFSNWFRDEVLGMYEGTAPTYPANGQFYIACCSTTSSAESPGTEITGNNYSRTLVTFEKVSDIQRWNPETVNSATSSAAWADLLSFTLWDAAVGGNYYAFGNLASPLSVGANKAVQWLENNVIIGMGQSV